MKKSKADYIVTRLLKEELPLMTPTKCAAVSKKVIRLLDEYGIIKPWEPEEVKSEQESAQFSKKS